MLIRFSVENFRSYKNETTFDFVSNSHIPFDPEHRYKFGRLSVVKSAGFFGANASGKSTIVEAMRAMQMFVVTNRITLNLAFQGQEDKPTKFSALFENNDVFFEYSFAVKIDKKTKKVNVVEESLYQLFQYGDSKLIYDRNSEFKSTNVDLITFNRFFQADKSGLFLNYIVAPERIIKGDKQSELFLNVFEFFKSNVFTCVRTGELLVSLMEENVEKISQKLHEYDTGIERVTFKTIPILDQIAVLNTPFVKNFVLPRVHNEATKNLQQYYCDGDNILMFKPSQNGISVQKLVFYHTNIATPFIFRDESEGTKAIFTLIATLLCNDNSKRTIFIDEIERSSHPSVVLRIIRDYQRVNSENKTQLIFTSHLHSLMDQALKRDEIYFVEKNDFGVSSIKTLLEYKSRNRRESVAERYFEGRFGAIPHLGVVV